MFDFYKNMKIGKKILLGFLILMIIVAIVAIGAIYGLSTLNKYVEKAVTVNLPVMDYLIQADRDLQQLLVAERSLMISSKNNDDYTQFLDEYNENMVQSDERWNKYKALANTPKELEIIPKYDQARKEWLSVTQNIISAHQQDSPESRQAALELSLGEGKEKFEIMREYINQLQELNVQYAEDLKTGSVKQYASNRIMAILFLAIGLLMGIVVINSLNKFVVSPIKKVTEMLKDIAQGEGDLTVRINYNNKDEVGELTKWFNVFVEKIHGLVKQVKVSIDQVGNASEEISSASEQMASGAEEQQSQLSEIATSMEQMSAMILESSKNANETQDNANQANKAAEDGTSTVQETIAGIENVANITIKASEQIATLEQRSSEIGKVIQVIDDIADQTNLLALNANIEAARAGEAGRGFAVVADEVRKLAERTVKATAEIGEQIKSIQGAVRESVQAMNKVADHSKDGQQVAAKAGEALEKISQLVKNVNQAIAQVASAADEQSSGAEEISKNVETVSTVAKEAASSAQELAASSEELNREVKALGELVGQFKV